MRVPTLISHVTLVAFLLSQQCWVVSPARILALTTLVSPSHAIWNTPLLRALANNGHQLVIFSPNKLKEPIPNSTLILIEGAYEFVAQEFDYVGFSETTYWETMPLIVEWSVKLCENQLGTKGFQQLVELSQDKKQKPFDLIIVEALIPECDFGIVKMFGSPPVVGITALGVAPWFDWLVGVPENPSYIPSTNLPFPQKMSFTERAVNLAMYFYTQYMWHYSFHPRVRAVAEPHFPDGVPDFAETWKKISLILVNNAPALHAPRPLPPAVIPVGGMQIGAVKPLPPDMETFVSGAKDGLILFSLGSNVHSDQMAKSQVQAFVEAFRELPQRVLWKWESEPLPDLPANVRQQKWLPQSDILGHPKTRLFITHCGGLSSHEISHRGVPIIGMPFFVDQHINIKRFRDLGIAQQLTYGEVTKQLVLDTVREVLEHPSYQVNAKRLSAVYRDRPSPPLDTAVFWVEHVLRHGGAPHLRSAALDLPWYSVMLLDVALVLGVGVVVVLGAVYIVLRALVRLCRKRSSVTTDKKRK